MPETVAPSSLRDTLDALSAKHRLRQLKTISDVHRPEITMRGKRIVDFSNNDYLGFAQNPILIEAASEALKTYGVGSAASRLISGTLDIHTQLEHEVAQWKQTPSALVFNSGYQANVGILSALASRHDWIASDKLNHASLIDGGLLSRAHFERYPHLDTERLEALLEKAPKDAQKFIVSDTVFSMDGDIAPLKTLYELSERYDAWLILDEAHATGVFGSQHRSGLWETTGLGHRNRVIQMGTFSKALGSFGAYVAASKDVIDTLIQFSRSFIYSTALPPSVIAANRAAIGLVNANASYTSKLWDNVRTLQALVADSDLMLEIQSPIIPVFVGDEPHALAATQHLLDAGFYVQAIRPPTVPEGTARLRVTLSAAHSEAQIAALVKELQALHLIISEN